MIWKNVHSYKHIANIEIHNSLTINIVPSSIFPQPKNMHSLSNRILITNRSSLFFNDDLTLVFLIATRHFPWSDPAKTTASEPVPTQSPNVTSARLIIHARPMRLTSETEARSSFVLRASSRSSSCSLFFQIINIPA